MLPIYEFKEQILDSVVTYPVTIITAETGAGKSTQVPQMFYEAGYRTVITEPRRLAACSLAERVAEEMQVEIGTTVGYITGFERSVSKDTKILYCTDGLQLIREITQTSRADVLVIDEVHEWNINIETLIAWTKHQLALGWNVRVVVMSATMESDKLKEFYGNANVISVPGRLFPVKEYHEYYRDPSIIAAELARKGRNVLVFVSGKKEIKDATELLERSGGNFVVLPLHGELDSKEQRKAFQLYSRPKIVIATNVAQTSVTIPDIDAVVDTGLENRIMLNDGIEGLFTLPISKADVKQRAGRAGRVKPGEYWYIGERAIEDLPDFPVAEIERSRLDQTVLRLAVVGIDATQFDFFHQPNKEEFTNAKKTLYALGAIDHNEEVTRIGKLMSSLPVSVQCARMLAEAYNLHVLNDVITIAAILEVGSIRAKEDYLWRPIIKDENRSDLLAELKLFKHAMNYDRSKDLSDIGVFKKSYFKALELRRKLIEVLRYHFARIESTGNEDNIIKACVAGLVEHLYCKEIDMGVKSIWSNSNDPHSRTQDMKSVVVGETWVVGMPLDLEIKNKFGMSRTLHLLTNISKVDLGWLEEVAPQLFEMNKGLNPRFDPNEDCCVTDTDHVFNKSVIKSEVVRNPDHPEAISVFRSWMKHNGIYPIEEAS